MRFWGVTYPSSNLMIKEKAAGVKVKIFIISHYNPILLYILKKSRMPFGILTTNIYKTILSTIFKY